MATPELKSLRSLQPVPIGIAFRDCPASGSHAPARTLRPCGLSSSRPSAVDFARGCAMREATGRSSEVRWAPLREVEKPIAPASRPIAKLGRASRQGLPSEASSSNARSPIDERSQRRMADVGRMVDTLWAAHPLHRDTRCHSVSQLKSIPACHCRAGNILGPLQIARDQRLLAFAHRRDGKAAITHHYGGNPVPHSYWHRGGPSASGRPYGCGHR